VWLCATVMGFRPFRGFGVEIEGNFGEGFNGVWDKVVFFVTSLSSGTSSGVRSYLLSWK